MDVEDIPPGQNFAQALDQRINDCAVFLVIIGPKWMQILLDRSIEKKQDYVRYEVEAALPRKIRVIPVLVGGAAIKQLNDLPGSLRELSLHQAAELRDSTFKEDCNRLAEVIKKEVSPNPQPATKRNRPTRLMWIVSLAAILGLFLTASIGIGPWNKYHARKLRIQQLLDAAQAQSALGEDESAYKTYAAVLNLDPASRIALDLQPDAAMRWVRNFHVMIGDGQKAEDLAGPPLAGIMSVLETAFSRSNGTGSRAADILAHLGWAHWLNQHIAQREFGSAPEDNLRRALKVDSLNTYGNAMLGNWLLQTNNSLQEAMWHFDLAVNGNQNRTWVRQMELGGLISNDSPGVTRELIRVVNQMRRSSEPMSDRSRNRILARYSASNDDEELSEMLSAVSWDDAWATFLWLDSKQLQGRAADDQQVLHGYIHARILELSGHTAEALALFKDLQQKMTSQGYSWTMTQHVAEAIKRISRASLR